jgi:hypothetical protein
VIFEKCPDNPGSDHRKLTPLTKPSNLPGRDSFSMRLCIMIAEHLRQAAIKPAMMLLE